jgi:hypothetical protein
LLITLSSLVYLGKSQLETFASISCLNVINLFSLLDLFPLLLLHLISGLEMLRKLLIVW